LPFRLLRSSFLKVYDRHIKDIIVWNKIHTERYNYGNNKKTISLPEELYREAEGISHNFSEIVKEALSEYIKRKKIEKTISTAGAFKDLKETGVEYVDKMRQEDLSIEEERINR